MTLFEYIAVAVSILLSFGAVRLLDGLPQALDRARSFWPQTILVINYFAVRARFFTLVACFILALAVSGWLIRDVPVFHRIRAVQIAGIAICLGGALSDSRALHRLLQPAATAALVLVTTALGLGLL